MRFQVCEFLGRQCVVIIEECAAQAQKLTALILADYRNMSANLFTQALAMAAEEQKRIVQALAMTCEEQKRSARAFVMTS